MEMLQIAYEGGQYYSPIQCSGEILGSCFVNTVVNTALKSLQQPAQCIYSTTMNFFRKFNV